VCLRAGFCTCAPPELEVQSTMDGARSLSGWRAGPAAPPQGQEETKDAHRSHGEQEAAWAGLAVMRGRVPDKAFDPPGLFLPRTPWKLGLAIHSQCLSRLADARLHLSYIPIGPLRQIRHPAGSLPGPTLLAGNSLGI
jgi:hypothetical protein